MDYLIELMSAALHGRKATRKPGGVRWEDVYRAAARHAVQPLVFAALPADSFADAHAEQHGGESGCDTGVAPCDANDAMPAELAAQWRRDADMALWQQISYDADREAILADFKEAGLSWLPLKGIMAANYYPQPGMRSMSDQDLVVGFVEPDGSGGWRPRGERRQSDEVDKLVMTIMAEHGYKELSRAGREHSFGKAPLHFEFHRSLVSAAELQDGQYGSEEAEYYANPWRLAKPQGEPPGEFRFPLDDEYIFHVAHMSKHYHLSGFGLRFLADEWLYCRLLDERGDADYIHRELKRLALDDFESTVRKLSIALFDHPDDWRQRVGRRELDMYECVLRSGIYGTMEQAIARRLGDDSAVGALPAMQSPASAISGKRIGVLAYWYRRIFPTREWIESYFPEWNRNAFTRAALLFHRIGVGLSKHPSALWREMKLVLRRRKP